MSAPPSKVWVLDPPLRGASRYVVGPEFGMRPADEYTPYYHISDELAERLRACAVGPIATLDEIFNARVNAHDCVIDLLNIIGEA